MYVNTTLLKTIWISQIGFRFVFCVANDTNLESFLPMNQDYVWRTTNEACAENNSVVDWKMNSIKYLKILKENFVKLEIHLNFHQDHYSKQLFPKSSMQSQGY